MSIFSKIKEWFTGGSKKSKSTSTSSGTTTRKKKRSDESYSSGGKTVSYGGSNAGYEDPKVTAAKQARARQNKAVASLASIGQKNVKKLDKKLVSTANKYGTIADNKVKGVDRALQKLSEKAKSAPPDPKVKAAKASRDRTTARLKEIQTKTKENRAEFHKATGNKYNVSTGNKAHDARARQRIKSGEYQSDADVEKYEVKKHPIATSATRGALSGVTFGASELMAQKSKNRQKSGAEEYYQKNKNKAAEVGGEIVGSLAGFGVTGGLSKSAVSKAGGKALEKASSKAVNKLALNNRVIRAAERELQLAIDEGAVNVANKAMRDRLVKQFAKNRASRIVSAVGEDMAINLTTGAMSDINHAILESDNPEEFARNMGVNAAMNVALGGTATLLPASTIKQGLPWNRRLRDETVGAIRATEAYDAMARQGGAALNNAFAPPRIGEAIDDTIARRSRQTAEQNLVDRQNVRQGAELRRALFDRANEADEALGRGFALMDDTLRTSTLDPNTTAVDIGRMANATNTARDARRRGALDRLLANAEANAPVGRRIGLDELVNVRSADDYARAARLEAVNAELEAVNEEIIRKRKYASAEELDALQRRFDELLSERSALEAPAEAAPPATAPVPEAEAAPIATDRYNAMREAEREQGLGTGRFVDPEEVNEEAARAVRENFQNTGRTEPDAPTAFDEYRNARTLSEENERIADQHADAIRDELSKPRKNPPRKNAGTAKKAPPKTDVNEYAAIDDASDMGFAKGGDEVSNAKAKVEEAVDNTKQSKSAFDKQRDEAYQEAGVDLNTNKEGWTANEQKELIDKNFRTTEEHTKRGFTTIAVTGDKGFKGVAHKAIESGETIIDVYHDKENIARGAMRVMSKADEEGGVQQMIKDFNEYAAGTRKLNTKETRDQLYDVIAAIDFANANKTEPWAEELYLAACKAGAEQTSVSGLSLRMWQKMAMSSPEYRAKAVRQQILDMFNKSKGMRKELGKLGRGNKITDKELEEFLKKNTALNDVLEELNKIGEATSADEVHELASKALLQARRTIPMTAFDQLTQWRYVAMLSSPKTHVRNITSNIYSATLGQLRDGIASGIEDSLIKNGKLEAAMKKQGFSADDYIKSTGGMSGSAWKDSHKGLAAGTELNSLKSKLSQAKMELESLSPSSPKVESIRKRISDLESAVKTKQGEYDKMVGEIKRPTAKKALEAWTSGGREDLVTNVEKFEKKVYNDGVSKGAFKLNDKLSKFIGNALETSDAISLERIFRERYDKILTANGWEKLAKAAEGNTKEAKAAAARLKRLEEYAMQEASYIAATDTYRNYNAVSTAMSKYVSDSLFNYDAPMYKKLLGGVLHATMPFTKVPVNLVKRGIDYSPIGLLMSKKALNKAISAGNVTEINRACERLAEGRIGLGIAALGAGLGFVDPDGMMINTRLDKNDTLDKRKRDAGYQDFSIQAAGRNITMEWLTPTSATLFTGVEFGRIVRNIIDSLASDNGMQIDIASVTDIPINLVSSLLEPSLQLSVFQGLNNSLENVMESDNYSKTNANPWLKMGTGIFADYAKSMMPTVIGQISRAMAPYDYFVTGDTDSLYGFNSTMAKIPFVSNQMFGAKTNSWGQIKNEKQNAGDYAKGFAKNLLSPANINKTTWDETDEQVMKLSETLGDDVFPKNNYNKDLTFGRNGGDVSIKMSNKELAEYNEQRGKSGSDAMKDALNTVIFNRWDKDENGHRTIPHKDNITDAEREKLIKQYEGKGIKEVVAYIINTPQFKNATPAEQKQIIKKIYGTDSDDSDESRGAKRYAERYIAGKHGIEADEYDYHNEVPRNAQEALAPYIESGMISYKQALDFCRNAGKTYYTTDERGEKGGTVMTRYNKKQMLEYLEKSGLSSEEAEVLYNAFKASNAKEYGASSNRRYYRRGYRRRGWRRWRRRGGSSYSGKVPKPTVIKASQLVQGEALVSKKKSSSSKATPPTIKRVKAKVDLPTARK